VIAQRLARAYEESEGMDAYDYIVVNDDLDECAASNRLSGNCSLIFMAP